MSSDEIDIKKTINAAFVMGALSSLIDKDPKKTLAKLRKLISDPSKFDNKELLELGFNIILGMIDNPDENFELIQKTMKSMYDSLSNYTKGFDVE